MVAVRAHRGDSAQLPWLLTDDVCANQGAGTWAPVYLRWEHTVPPHRKCYELEVELSLFYPKVLTRRWGRIGSLQSRGLRILVTSAEAMRREVTTLVRRRRHHGYALVKEV